MSEPKKKNKKVAVTSASSNPAGAAGKKKKKKGVPALIGNAQQKHWKLEPLLLLRPVHFAIRC